MNALVTITDQKAVTTSLIVAEAFEKRHDTVLRSISRLECSDDFRLRNFAASSYLNEQNKPQPMYQITRDGFTFLAMGFTGKRAAEFKEKFIAAFNQMEQALFEDQGDFRRVDINHKRGITNPHGLDVQFRLDLTKIIIRPTREGLEILQRITGIDMEGIMAGQPAGVPQDISQWIEEKCIETVAGKITAAEAYSSFLKWWAANFNEKPPSQKRFGEAISLRAYRKDRGAPGGAWRYLGLELREVSG